MIHQELQQVPELTVAQNIFLGGALRRAGGLLVDRVAQEAEARRLLAPLDATIDVTAEVKGLRVAQRQLIEIAKALRARAKIIAMDESTSSLTPLEFEKLVAVIDGLTAQGVSVIYVSHKLDEVFRLCRSATILRDGHLMAQAPIPQTPVAQVIETMVGRALALISHHSHSTDRVMMRVAGLSCGKAVQDASFDLHAGEVVGIAGLVGAGRTELLRLISGVDRADSGTVEADGAVLPQAGPRARISGFMAAVAAMILIGRLGAAEPTTGTLWELDAIAASAIGGHL